MKLAPHENDLRNDPSVPETRPACKERERPFGRITADCILAKIPLPEKLAIQFERIANHLNSIWGTSAAGDYLDELIFSERIDRRGFPPEVATEIVALKRLHQQKYVNARDSAWDSYDKVYEAKSGNKVGQSKSADNAYEAKSTNKVYEVKSPGTGNTTPLSLAHMNDAIHAAHQVKRAKPSPGRQRRLAILRLFPGSALEPTAIQSRPVRTAATDRDEILEDAEVLLAEGRLHSSIGLFEQLIALHPAFSAYPYLRLLELYYELDRRTEFELVASSFSRHFECELVRWTAADQDFWTQLDQVADDLAQTRHHLSQASN